MTEVLLELSIDQLHPAADNPRRDVGDLKDLAVSMQAVGVLEPIVATKNGDGYTIVCGHRRHAAAKVAGLETVPVVVRELDDRGRVEAMVVENLQREDLGPLDEAAGYQLLIDLGTSQRALGARIGVSQSHISKRLGLLEIEEPAKKALDSGVITIDDAMALRELAGMPKLTEEALKLGKQWRNMRRGILEVVRKRAIARVVGVEEAKAKAEGVTLVQRNYDHNKQRPIGSAYGGLGLKKPQHRKEPCHAAYIEQSGQWKDDRYEPSAKLVYVCTDPKRHSKKGASELKAPKGVHFNERPAVRTNPREVAKAKALKEAKAARVERVRELLNGRSLSSKDVLDVLSQGVVDRALYDAQVIAVDLLGLEVEKRKQGGRDVRGAIARFVEAKPANLRKAALALSFANDELGVGRGWIGSDTARYLRFLAAHGHELHAIEQEMCKDAAAELCDHCGEAECFDTCTGAMAANGQL